MADINIKCPKCDAITAVSEFIDSDSAVCKSCGVKLELPKNEDEIKPIDKLRLKKKEIPHEYRVSDGEHNWTYWRNSLPDALKFISESFTRYDYFLIMANCAE